MALRINSEAPNFTADTTQGRIDFHQWIGDGWAILFSHPKNFTPVCTTELGYMAGLKPEFDRRNCKIIGLSVDSVSDHDRWAKDIEETQGHALTYPMIGDPELKVAKAYDMLPAETRAAAQGRTAADNATVRSVFVIGPDKKVKAMLTYPMSTGRNFDEVLRLLDSCQLTAKHKVATPVNWKQGEDVIIVPAVSDAEAKQQYPGRLEVAEALHPDRAAAALTAKRGRGLRGHSSPGVPHSGQPERGRERRPRGGPDEAWEALVDCGSRLQSHLRGGHGDGRRRGDHFLDNPVSSDPTPDLFVTSPNGSHVFSSLRGPFPLTADPHVSTGSTPGVGVIKVLGNGKDGVFEAVAPVSNTDAGGVERADVHAITIRLSSAFWRSRGFS